jgi:predicted transposase YdaD
MVTFTRTELPSSLMHGSDSIYHRLFSHPRMVEELVREFVPDALAAGLDFSRLQRVNPKFHTDRDSAERRVSDVIWRLPTRAGAEVYLYLLLEFQSTSDWWMAVRTQVYQGLLWQQVIQEKALNSPKRLPPVMLLVLYTGERRWRAPTELTDLIDLAPGSTLWSWQPQARYYLLDMGAFTAGDLAGRESLAALLFRLEQEYPAARLEELIGEVIGWFRQHPELEELKRLFAELLAPAISSIETQAQVPHDLLEVKSMLATIGKVWREEWLAEGRAAGKAEGKAEGKIEGKVEGKAESLLRLLTARFGVLPPAVRKGIEAADLATIERWFDHAIEASDLSSVFRREPGLSIDRGYSPTH